MLVKLYDIAFARSGDKGSTANIGVAARSPEFYDVILEQVTAERVHEYFEDICEGKVIRYELANLRAINLVLTDVLDGGGTRSLRMDPQGKTLCDALMLMPIELEARLANRVGSL